MLLTDAIHTRWEADATLEAALPVSRLKTIENVGGSASTDPGEAEPTPGTVSTPFCVVSIDGAGPSLNTNAGTVDLVDVTFQLFHASYATGRVIANHIKRVFSRVKFNVGTGEQVINMKRRSGGYTELRDPDGTFRFVMGFDVQDYLVAGY